MYGIVSGMVTVVLEEEITLTRDGVSDEVVSGGEAVQLGPGDGFMWMPESAGQLAK
jgi:hypothetical protein